MAIIVQDSFNRGDSSSLGTAETGQIWSYSNKPYGIRSNEAYLHLNGSTSFDSVAYIDSGISDCKVTWKIATYQASNSRLIFRYVDFSNYLAIEPRASDIRIYKKVANTTTTVGTFSHPSANGDVLMVELTGTTVKVYVNGTLKTTITITEMTTATKYGMFANNTELVRYDDFIVEDFNVGGNTGTEIISSYASKQSIYAPREVTGLTKQTIYKNDSTDYSLTQFIYKTNDHVYQTKQKITLANGQETRALFSTKQQISLKRTTLFSSQQDLKGKFYKTLILSTSNQSEIKAEVTRGDSSIELVTYIGKTVYQPNDLRSVSEMEVMA